MRIDIINNSPTPIYQQLHDQIAAQIITGKLGKNETLPPIRTLAKDLRISIITVKKAWELLEKEGLIKTVVGRGSFVGDLSSSEITDKKIEKMTARMKKEITYYQQMGISLNEYIAWLRSIWDQ
jgi:GntR family transcriptional regulator